MADKDKTQIFIDKAKKVWGDTFFDYKDVVYVKNDIPIILWYNGIKIKQTPKHHLAHHLPIELSEKKKHNNDELIKKFIKKHNGKYSYGDFVYKNAKEKNIPVYCPIIGENDKPHGWWFVNATNHLSGCGCPKCKSEKLSHFFASNAEDFINKAIKVHGDKYDYSKVNYINNKTDVLITCKEHGDFYQSPHNHLQGKGCPFCKESHLENVVKQSLFEHKITFEYQKRFKWLGLQSLDFYLPDYKIAIECQGEQHYKEGHFNESLSEQIKRDNEKKEKCKHNGIQILYFASEKYDKNVINNINELIRNIDYSINIDKTNLDKITNFLNENKIPFNYEVSKIIHNDAYITIQDIFNIPQSKLKIIYINSYDYRKKDENGDGISTTFFINETKKINEEGYNVIWIKDYEMFENTNGYFRKWEVIKSYIKYAVGLSKHKIYARDCEIHEVTNNELKNFLNKNCFYGYRPAKINLGLYLKKDCGVFHKGDLVMVYTFGNNFYGKNNEDGVIEVIRVSTILDTHVNGGSSKLLKFFENNYKSINIGRKVIKPKKLIFYVDADHNNGKSLTNNGFNFIRWESGFMNVNSMNCAATMRKPFKNKEINEMVKNKQVYISPTNGTMVFEKYIKENG